MIEFVQPATIGTKDSNRPALDRFRRCSSSSQLTNQSKEGADKNAFVWLFFDSTSVFLNETR